MSPAEKIELNCLLLAIYEKYGYDFRSYARDSLERRIDHFLRQEQVPTISALQHAMLNDQNLFFYLLSYIFISVTEMFRDPSFYQSFGQLVIPSHRVKYERAKFSDRLKQRMVFSEHNLVTDGRFGEMDVIFCRNVMIYFNRELQERVFRLFMESLTPRGFLCLGAQETVKLSALGSHFNQLRPEQKIFQKAIA